MVKIYVIDKRYTRNGNPRYKLFIPEISGKVQGLRKLKDPHTYSIESYNLTSDLKNYVFKGKIVELRKD